MGAKVFSVLGKTGLFLENVWCLLRHRHVYEDFLTYHPIPSHEEKVYRRITLRHLDCGSCHGCELSLLRLLSPSIDIQKFNIKFEASPKHACYLLVTGPMTLNSIEAAKSTLNQLPKEAVIAFGDCAVSGGIFSKSYATLPRSNVFIDKLVLYEISGCPPNPFKAIDQLLQIPTKL